MNLDYIKPWILYKKHAHIDCDKFLDIVRYLYSIGYDIRPHNIIEKNFPSNITILPTIKMDGYFTVVGIDRIIEFYESILKITNLLHKSEKFCKLNPDYRISDISTHKNIKLIK